MIYHEDQLINYLDDLRQALERILDKLSNFSIRLQDCNNVSSYNTLEKELDEIIVELMGVIDQL